MTLASWLLIKAGALGWTLTMVVVIQRQRVLDRRLARVERELGLRRTPHTAQRTPKASLHPVSLPVARPPATRSQLTVKHLARLAVPLQRAGG